MSNLSITAAGFMLDGQPFRFIAGAIHYFRVPRACWRDRLKKLRACGFNAVETYVAWNAHAPTEDVFTLQGNLDIAAFLKTAQEEGLYAILRPGPYICSEWEFGGLPWWLLKYDDLALRCMNDRYLAAVDGYFDRLIPAILPCLSTHGGPVLMMQVENEYGSYGDDQAYLTHIRDGLVRRGVDVPLFTSDGPTDFMLTGGTLPGCLKTGNFGGRAAEQFDKLRQHQPDGPLMCCEFWNGWFDHWTEPHHTRSPQEAAQVLDDILACGASVSAYMFHGGTNFGFMNGANGPDGEHGVNYQPTVNSYDDDAPVNECGDLTEKYHLFRRVVGKYANLPPMPAFSARKKAYGTVTLTQCADLLSQADALSAPVSMTTPLPMEKLNQGYGFILYRTHVRGPREEMPLIIRGLHDRAHIFVNGILKGIQYRNDAKPAVTLSVPPQGLDLAILVENMGRINYGPNMLERKGIDGMVGLGQTFLYHWQALPLPLTDLNPVTFGPMTAFDGRPQLLRGTFQVTGEPADTFLRTDGFTKGVVFLNGHCLSRYWDVGPQKTMYIPAPMLVEGTNELIILELDGRSGDTVSLTDVMDVDGSNG